MFSSRETFVLHLFVDANFARSVTRSLLGKIILIRHSACHTGNFKFYCEICRKGFFQKEFTYESPYGIEISV